MNPFKQGKGQPVPHVVPRYRYVLTVEGEITGPPHAEVTKALLLSAVSFTGQLVLQSPMTIRAEVTPLLSGGQPGGLKV